MSGQCTSSAGSIVLFEQTIKNGKSLYVTFIDYSAAFDSISHKFEPKARGNE